MGRVLKSCALAAALAVAALTTGLAHADSYARGGPSLADMTLDTSTLAGQFQHEFTSDTRIEYSSVGAERMPTFAISITRVEANPFIDMPYGGPEHLARVQAFCDGNFEGTCEIIVPENANVSRLSFKVVRDRDGRIAISNEAFIDNTFITAITYLPPNSDRDAGRRNVANLMGQAVSFLLQ